MNGLEIATFPVVGEIGLQADTYLEITGVYPPPEAEEGPLSWRAIPAIIALGIAGGVLALIFIGLKK